MRIIRDLKKYNSIQNTDKSHSREYSLKVPWESQIGRDRKERREREKKKKAQQIEFKNIFMTDCT